MMYKYPITFLGLNLGIFVQHVNLPHFNHYEYVYVNILVPAVTDVLIAAYYHLNYFRLERPFLF